jgi:hypothetical protein
MKRAFLPVYILAGALLFGWLVLAGSTTRAMPFLGFTDTPTATPPPPTETPIVTATPTATATPTETPPAPPPDTPTVTPEPPPATPAAGPEETPTAPEMTPVGTITLPVSGQSSQPVLWLPLVAAGLALGVASWFAIRLKRLL